MMEDPALEHGAQNQSPMEVLEGALVEALTRHGILGKVRAQLRSAAVEILRSPVVHLPRQVNRNVAIAYLLVDEFLSMHQFSSSQGVFAAECSNLGELKLSRGQLASELRIDVPNKTTTVLDALIAERISDGGRNNEQNEKRLPLDMSMLTPPPSASSINASIDADLEDRSAAAVRKMEPAAQRKPEAEAQSSSSVSFSDRSVENASGGLHSEAWDFMEPHAEPAQTRSSVAANAMRAPPGIPDDDDDTF